MRRELISKALVRRFRDLRERVSQLAPENFGEQVAFVAQVRALLLEAEFASLKNQMPASDAWLAADENCLVMLRRFSLGERVELRPGAEPSPTAAFLQALRAARAELARRFQLLTERYACPLNFTHAAEEEAREYLLTSLMVNDRARIERDSLAAIESDDLLLRLNLLALYAPHAADLRFLDALNYYYELLPTAWQPTAQRIWLLPSFFALYARALASWTDG